MIAEIADNVHFVGAIHWDRRLFDELIPLPDGTSYNSYLIKGTDRIALIDAVDPSKEEDLLKNLGAKAESIDYIIANHAEQDHSGGILKVLESYPMAKVVTNEKCKKSLMDLLLIPEKKFITVKDNESISLGDKTLQFIYAPWVHWPETMLTYLKEDRILFTCDLFGAHLATSDIYATGGRVYEAAKRYYAEIMMPFRNNIKMHMEKIKDLDIEMIAPSHGPVHNPEFILDAYQDWVSDDVKEEVILPYVSMHGSVEKMVSHLTDALVEKGIEVKPFNLTKTDIGQLAKALVDASTLVLAAPTVLLGPHPAAMYAAYLVNILRPKLKYISVIGSYGWGGNMLDQLKATLPNLKAEFIEPVIIKGYPRKEDLAQLDRLAADIQKKMNL